MERISMAFPVLPGKTTEAVESIPNMLRSRPDEYKESRNAKGVKLERAYHQPTPMGDFVVAYFESDGPMMEAMMAVATSDLAIDKDFVRLVKEIHGVDLTAPPEGPPPETVGSWADPNASGHAKGVAFCAPVKPGADDVGIAFGKEAFTARVDELAASRRALGVTVEVVTVQETPHGTIACVYFEGADPVKANEKFAASQEPFDVWFKGELAKIFPPEIDFTKPVPQVTEIFDSVGLL